MKKIAFLILIFVINFGIHYSVQAQTKRGGGGVPNDEITNIRLEKLDQKIKAFLIIISKRFHLCEEEPKQFKDLIELRILMSLKTEIENESIFNPNNKKIGCESYQPNQTIVNCLFNKKIQEELRSFINDDFFDIYLNKYYKLNEQERESILSFYQKLTEIELQSDSQNKK